MSIDRYDTSINKDEVDERVTELEDERGYEVVRVRNDEVIDRFDSESDAESYIEDEDYDPVRVVVRPGELDEADTSELTRLRELDAEMDSAYGESWRDGDVTLYESDFFDADWAQERAQERLGLSRRADLSSDFPFNYIDWDSVATQERDDNYTSIRFDGAYFYAEDQ